MEDLRDAIAALLIIALLTITAVISGVMLTWH
jgi:hypothetical protein